MAPLWYTFEVYDDAGKPVEGQQPTWMMLRKLDDGSDVVPQPRIEEVGCGIYKFQYDPSGGDVAGSVVVKVPNATAPALVKEMSCGIRCNRSDILAPNAGGLDIQGTLRFLR